MRIDGKAIATKILNNLKKDISLLKAKDITPHLAVVMTGSDPASLVYIRRKEKVGAEIGTRVTILQAVRHLEGGRMDSLPVNGFTNQSKVSIFELIDQLNKDKSIHGIIVQRPVAIEIDKNKLNLTVAPEKDVDGFHPDSPFAPPVVKAVLKILEHVYNQTKHNSKFHHWLKKKHLLVIGRGETAGRPIAKRWQKLGLSVKVAHRKTRNLKQLCQSANIIISCVGKSNVVRPQMLAGQPILIGVGLHSEKGKLKGDYSEEDIKDKALAHTPTPGGIGPVNVACLFENLVKATKIQQG